MAKFIELKQYLGWDSDIEYRKIMVNIDHIQFFYDKRIVFGKDCATNVLESYEEITKLINRES